MSAEAYLWKVRSRNPKIFDAKEVKITPANIEKIIRQAFDEGYKEGKGSKSVFEGLFGKPQE